MSDQEVTVTEEAYRFALQSQIDDLTRQLVHEKARRIQAEQALAIAIDKHPDLLEAKTEVVEVKADDSVGVEMSDEDKAAAIAAAKAATGAVDVPVEKDLRPDSGVDVPLGAGVAPGIG